MENIFEQLFQYGFHDTTISSIDINKLEVELTFNDGIYSLDENEKETKLTKPIKVVFSIKSKYETSERVLEIRDYSKKVRYIDLLEIKKLMRKNGYGISMIYFSKFDNCILIDGAIGKHQIMISIEGIDRILFDEFL